MVVKSGLLELGAAIAVCVDGIVQREGPGTLCAKSGYGVCEKNRCC